MFTGIIEELGTVIGVAHQKANRRLTVRASRVVRELKNGDSIAVNGVCLTAVEIGPKFFSADLAQETWRRTSFSRIRAGSPVNLELPMRANALWGGHIVQGHVDGTGTFLSLKKIPSAKDYWLAVEIPAELTRYVIAKGSICIDGISLTVAGIKSKIVRLAIIPHTAKMTNLKSLKAGDPVNLEVDVIAKYVERMLPLKTAPHSITLEKLLQEGF